MKIAMLASNFIKMPPVPEDIPKGYSGAPEYIVWMLTEALVKKGHQVTLFASGDSKSSAKLECVSPVSTFHQPRGTNIEFILDQEHLLVAKLYKMAKDNKFDIIHSHLASRSAFYASFVKTPTVVTLHSPLNGEAASVLACYPKDQYYVSISNRQRLPLPDLKYIGTVYHGLDLAKIPYTEKGGDYLLFVGRLTPQKGVLEAIKVAKDIKKKLVILGTPPKGSAYFEKKIKPLVDGKNIEVHGFVDRKSLYERMGKACCLLFPIQWEEPFGLVMIEAMSCGTPVVAFDRGSVSEVIDEGVSGFIVSSRKGVAGMVNAVSNVCNLERINCRKQVEKKFSLEKMVGKYEEVYKKILNKS